MPQALSERGSVRIHFPCTEPQELNKAVTAHNAHFTAGVHALGSTETTLKHRVPTNFRSHTLYLQFILSLIYTTYNVLYTCM